MPNKIVMPEGVPRSLECLLATVGIIILSPLFLICALLVRLSSAGPILFKQDRVGYNGKIFKLYKFRTMVCSKDGLLVTAEGDRRITPIGRILRRSKLDELPEIYNVLRGDMSLVGPRPEVSEYVNFDNLQWNKILSVRPGITDPVTLQMRNEEVFLAKVKDEDKETYYKEVIQPYKLTESINYLENRTFFKDIQIIIQTFKVIMFPQTAPQPTFEMKSCLQTLDK